MIFTSQPLFTEAEPNEAHKALAKLEKVKLKAVVTQNIFESRFSLPMAAGVYELLSWQM